MFTVFGLPAHILLVHAVVVSLPLSALLTLGVALSTRFRERYGVAVVAFTFVATLWVPLATQAGESLRAALPSTPLIARHAMLGNLLVPFAAAFGLSLVALVWVDLLRRAVVGEGRAPSPLERWIVDRAPRIARPSRPGAWLEPTLAGARTLAVALSLAVGVLVVLAGDSGARAVWSHHPGLNAARAKAPRAPGAAVTRPGS